VAHRRVAAFRPDDGDRIETKRSIGVGRLLLQPRRQPRETTTLALIDLRLRRRQRGRAGLDLDQGDRAAIRIEGDEVGLVVSQPAARRSPRRPVSSRPRKRRRSRITCRRRTG
jgi:hypothetical protein